MLFIYQINLELAHIIVCYEVEWPQWALNSTGRSLPGLSQTVCKFRDEVAEELL